MTFGEKLTKLRKERGLTQEELSDRLQISVQTLSRWERDKSLPDVGQFSSLCKEIGVQADLFLTKKAPLSSEDEQGAPPTETAACEEAAAGRKPSGRQVAVWVALGAVLLAATAGLLWLLFRNVLPKRDETLVQKVTSTYVNWPELIGGILLVILIVAVAVLLVRNIIKYRRDKNK